MDQCPFCGWREIPDLYERLILETTGFVVVASLGQIVPGYVNIFPKRHVTCLAELTIPELAELTLIRNQLAQAMVGVYGQWPVAFEHGRAGQTVGHAHAHLAPLSELRKRMMAVRIKTDFGGRMLWIGSLDELRFRLNKEERYLLFEERVFVVPASADVRPGYLREVLAVVVDAPDWADWREVDPEEDTLRWQETLDLLRAYLETAGVPLEVIKRHP